MYTYKISYMINGELHTLDYVSDDFPTLEKWSELAGKEAQLIAINFVEKEPVS